MPTYEYACIDCGTHVEVYQRFSDDPLTTCGACSGRLRKVFHPAGILFKGSGFYKTDSRPSKGSSDGGASSKKPSTDTAGNRSPSSGGDASKQGSGQTASGAGQAGGKSA